MEIHLRRPSFFRFHHFILPPAHRCNARAFEAKRKLGTAELFSAIEQQLIDAMHIPLLRLFATMCTTPPAKVAAVLTATSKRKFYAN